MLAAATNSKAMWYLTRGTGMVSLVLLTASVALGIAEVVRFATPRWPRFVVAALHRNISLLATAFLAVHIITAVADSFAPIRIVDVFVPFVGTYRPLWLGLGAVGLDLLLALVISSLLRERIGYKAWRAVHWAAYACWPVALLHGLGTGSDTRVRWAVFINLACLAAVVAAIWVRVGWTRTASSGRRVLAALGTTTIAVGVVAWMLAEPMRPGWARKAGTPSALLASSSAATLPAPSGAAASALARIPIPFTSAVRGTIRQTSPAPGRAAVVITARLSSLPGVRLRVVIEGTPLADGGVSMDHGTVRLGVTGTPDVFHGSCHEPQRHRCCGDGARGERIGRGRHHELQPRRHVESRHRNCVGPTWRKREMAIDAGTAWADSPPAADAPHFSRLLPPAEKRSFADHLDWYGDLPATHPALIGEVERSGLRGKGGARFPTATKLAAVASRRRAVVVANGTEGEPASTKDVVLMSQVPHLVLDGAVVAAEMVGASEVIFCIKRGSVVQPMLERALAERLASSYDAVPIRIVGAPNRYVSGEETALVNWLNGGDAKPTVVPPRPFERGVAGRPTLVQNVETLSDIALIARFGSEWYRSAGTPADPGTTLVTLSGAVTKPGVCEMPFGVRIGDLLRVAGADCADLSGVLVGGYFGAWLPAAAAADVRLGVDDLKRAGGGLGAGIVVAMPSKGVCALAELARATRWLADQNAGQCGPCVNGLDAIAGAMAELAAGGKNSGRAESHLAGSARHDGRPRRVQASRRRYQVRGEWPARASPTRSFGTADRVLARRAAPGSCPPPRPEAGDDLSPRAEPDHLCRAWHVRRALPRAHHARRLGIPDHRQEADPDQPRGTRSARGRGLPHTRARVRAGGSYTHVGRPTSGGNDRGHPCRSDSPVQVVQSARHAMQQRIAKRGDLVQCLHERRTRQRHQGERTYCSDRGVPRCGIEQ